MTRFFAGVLSVIAMGVLFIAYGLFNPRAEAVAVPNDRAASDRMSVREDTYPLRFANDQGLAPQTQPPAGYVPAGYGPAGYVPAGSVPAGYVPAAQAPVTSSPYPAPQPVQTVVGTEAPGRASAARPRGRNWKKTGLVIGGSTATGAGVGAIVAGKKGALIGAAIGGGASTIYESTK